MQETSAGVLASLALFGPGAEALRAHAGVMGALRALRDGVSCTEASRQSAVQALFQLEERKKVKPSSGTASKHDRQKKLPSAPCAPRRKKTGSSRNPTASLTNRRKCVDNTYRNNRMIVIIACVSTNIR